MTLTGNYCSQVCTFRIYAHSNHILPCCNGYFEDILHAIAGDKELYTQSTKFLREFLPPLMYIEQNRCSLVTVIFKALAGTGVGQKMSSVVLSTTAFKLSPQDRYIWDFSTR